MDKILQSHSRGGSVSVTNDGATILKSVLIDNPAAKVLIDISKVQDDEVGDGTTSVCVLAGEFLRQAAELIEKKMHPQTVVDGYRLARKAALDALEKSCVDNSKDPAKFREDLVNIAKTTLSSKVLSQDKEHFSEIAVEAVLIPQLTRGKATSTLCVSSQVGCAMGCAFCATGVSVGGARRRLAPACSCGGGGGERRGSGGGPRAEDVVIVEGRRLGDGGHGAAAQVDERGGVLLRARSGRVVAGARRDRRAGRSSPCHPGARQRRACSESPTRSSTPFAAWVGRPCGGGCGGGRGEAEGRRGGGAGWGRGPVAGVEGRALLPPGRREESGRVHSPERGDPPERWWDNSGDKKNSSAARSRPDRCVRQQVSREQDTLDRTLEGARFIAVAACATRAASIYFCP